MQESKCCEKVQALNKLVTASLLTIVTLSSGSAFAQSFESAELEINFVKTYEPIWNDKGSGAGKDVSFWRPKLAAGWQSVGHHAKPGYDRPTQGTMVVKARTEGILASPSDYTLVWNDAGSGASQDGSVWRPNCPAGYQVLGDIANGSHQKPSLDEVKCVRESALTKTLPSGAIWNDSGSGANNDFSAWDIQAATSDIKHSYINQGLFFSVASHSRPTNASAGAWALRVPLMSDDLFFATTQTFKKVWDDAGSGVKRDVGFFSPIPPTGYYSLGHYAHASHAMPDAVVMVVKEKASGTLAAPTGYNLIWNDAGSGAKKDGAAWWPQCPGGYSALGVVTTSGAKPSADAIRCVRSDLTAQAKAGKEIWNDSGSGAKNDFGSWSVSPNKAPPGEAHIAPGTFIANGSHSNPSAANARVIKIKLP